jgi:hypothetical protein
VVVLQDLLVGGHPFVLLRPRLGSHLLDVLLRSLGFARHTIKLYQSINHFDSTITRLHIAASNRSRKRGKAGSKGGGDGLDSAWGGRE